ncbi:MAG: exodeoxyribonuclease VII large subunit [Gammaproteobacteria bacterium]
MNNVLTITALNQAARSLLEKGLGTVWVEGEISNFTRAPSGHIYFSLKDEKAQVRAAMFKGSMRGGNVVFSNGMHVLARARVGIYEARGDYQLVVEHMEEAGLGALQRAFELLKAKLAQEGLFAPEHKKPIPAFVETLGVITSPTGAALQDILHTLERRYPLMRVIVYPTLVQGKEASAQIARAIEDANRHGLAQLLILARGGGSLEDLFAFNEENVARAIFASGIPIISGVGHETDVTIADFVADLRAATPTAAAELASPDQVALLHRVTVLTQKLTRSMETMLQAQSQRLMLLEKSLIHPGDVLQRMMQRVDLLSEQLTNRFLHLLNGLNTQVTSLSNRLSHCHPKIALDSYTTRVAHLQSRLNAAMDNVVIRKTQQLGAMGRELHALSPLAVLDRGYSITLSAAGNALRSVNDVSVGDVVETRLVDGSVRSTVI